MTIGVIRNIFGIILVFFLVSCSVVSGDNQPEPKISVDQPRVFKEPLFETIFRDMPIIDKWRNTMLDRLESINKKLIPEDKSIALILINTEYVMYIAFHVSIAEGDQVAADHYKEKIINIYEAIKVISNKYAIPSGGDKNEF